MCIRDRGVVLGPKTMDALRKLRDQSKNLGDAAPGAATVVLENGVDLERFHPEPETPGERLLFIGSFRHFPNIAAYRFFTECVWPLLREKFPRMTVTVVAGADPLTYWRAFADSPEPRLEERIRLLDFVSDVRPLYVESNLAIVPTTVSAGTNVKVPVSYTHLAGRSRRKTSPIARFRAPMSAWRGPTCWPERNRPRTTRASCMTT